MIDFGYCTVIGDGKLNILFAADFAASSTGEDQANDLSIVKQWLNEQGLLEYLPAAQRMVAAYWSFVTDDNPLDLWCQRIPA